MEQHSGRRVPNGWSTSPLLARYPSPTGHGYRDPTSEMPIIRHDLVLGAFERAYNSRLLGPGTWLGGR